MFRKLFESNYPNLADKIKSSKNVICEREMEVKLIDGRAYIFDGYHQTLRQLPKNSKYLTKDEFRIEFAYRLRKVMAVKKVSQVELSHATDIQITDINRYVNGKAVPTFYNVDKIAKALDVSVDEFRYI